MPGKWAGSTRATRLPPNWKTIRRRILQRDNHRCVICGEPATEVDHVIAGDDHAPVNLRSLCVHHHRRKSSVEGNAARWKNRHREPEPHPGVIR